MSDDLLEIPKFLKRKARKKQTSSNTQQQDSSDKILWDPQRWAAESKEKKKLAREKSSVSQPAVKKQSVHDRVKIAAGEIIGEIEYFVDCHVLGTSTEDFDNPYKWMVDNNVKGPHARLIAEYYQPLAEELTAVLRGEDKELVEGYKSASKKFIKDHLALIQLIIDDAVRIAANSVKSRKPRKKRSRSVEKQIAKFKYLIEKPDMKLTSVDPAKIIGAMEVWLYNTKYQTLTVLVAQTRDGFSIKGTTIQGVDEQRSLMKRTRDVSAVQKLAEGGKRIANAMMTKTIKSKALSASGRTSKDMIVVKVDK